LARTGTVLALMGFDVDIVCEEYIHEYYGVRGKVKSLFQKILKLIGKRKTIYKNRPFG